MAQKRLNELLKEDQEPFLLKDYIAERRTQLRSSSSCQVQLKKRKPISETPNFPGKFCKNACFLPFKGSPELGKSQLFDFASPASKSPQTAVFLHISARIRKQSSPAKPKATKTHRFGLFESILKRLTSRNRRRSREIEAGKKVKVSVKDILRWDSSVRRISDQRGNLRHVGAPVTSSAVWSETNGDKSPDPETSSCCSSRSGESGDIFACRDGDIAGDCESPFRFALQRTPSSGGRTPEFLSPAASPSRNKTEEEENCEVEMLRKSQSGGEEEEKEQCSPVSVLDPPFEDEDHGHEDGFDIETSYVIVERAKLQLLQKLRRFEKLANLDPIELDKRMRENEDEEEEQECQYDEEEASSDCERSIDGFVREELSGGRLQNQDWHVPKFLKQLYYDIVSEEEKQRKVWDEEQDVMKRVLERLESWKEVESNTIDMMVEQDFRREHDLWKRNEEQVGETAAEVEVAIFGVLVEELWN